jgi:hypothetical protein
VSCVRSGTSIAQRASATGQRGWNGQPPGGATGEGGSPESGDGGGARGSSLGIAASRARVYGWRAPPKISSTVPVSTIRPQYITATRSATCRTTARSCAMKR